MGCLRCDDFGIFLNAEVGTPMGGAECCETKIKI
jgi:hypothetical protein